MLHQKAEERIKIEDIMKHPWINEGHYYDPLQSSPFPAFRTSSELNDIVLTRMVASLGYLKEDIIRSVCENKPSTASATYCLMEETLRNISYKRRQSRGLRPCYSDSQVEVQSLITATNRQADDPSLMTEASSSFKKVVREMKQEETKKHTALPQTQKSVRTSRFSDVLMVRRSSTDSKINQVDAREHGENTSIERKRKIGVQIGHSQNALFRNHALLRVARRASINTILTDGRRIGGLRLAVAPPTKSNKVCPTGHAYTRR